MVPASPAVRAALATRRIRSRNRDRRATIVLLDYKTSLKSFGDTLESRRKPVYVRIGGLLMRTCHKWRNTRSPRVRLGSGLSVGWADRRPVEPAVGGAADVVQPDGEGSRRGQDDQLSGNVRRAGPAVDHAGGEGGLSQPAGGAVKLPPGGERPLLPVHEQRPRDRWSRPRGDRDILQVGWI